MHHVDDPERMTPEERETEVASILAAGLPRLQQRGVRLNGQNVAEKRGTNIPEDSPELP
jgi:hypothetical protein